MKVLDKAVIAVQRRIRRRRRERELTDMALPGLEGTAPRVPSAEAHTAAHGGAGGLLAWRKSPKVALAAIVVAAGVGFPAYLTGASIASAGAAEEAEEAAYEEASTEFDAAQSREAAALKAAVAAYSAEREADGETIPREAAIQRLQAEHGLSEVEAADAAEGGPVSVLAGQTPVTAEAERMWSEEPPQSETARERIQDYEAASEEADRAEAEYEAELDRVIEE